MVRWAAKAVGRKWLGKAPCTEVGIVEGTLDLGHVGRRELLRLEGAPVEADEPGVVLDVGRAVLEAAETTRRVDTEEAVDEVARRRGELRRP